MNEQELIAAARQAGFAKADQLLEQWNLTHEEKTVATLIAHRLMSLGQKKFERYLDVGYHLDPSTLTAAFEAAAAVYSGIDEHTKVAT
jgi:hypothetical protein